MTDALSTFICSNCGETRCSEELAAWKAGNSQPTCTYCVEEQVSGQTDALTRATEAERLCEKAVKFKTTDAEIFKALFVGEPCPLWLIAQDVRRLEAESRNYSEALDNVREVLGLEGTHWLVIHENVKDLVAENEGIMAKLRASNHLVDDYKKDFRDANEERLSLKAENERLRGALPDDILDEGWSIAGHYEILPLPNGKRFFWKFYKDETYIERGGKTNAEALNEIRRAIRGEGDG